MMSRSLCHFGFSLGYERCLLLLLLTYRQVTAVLTTVSTHSPCTIAPDPEFGGSKVDCSSRGLRFLQPEWFPVDTTWLVLDGNPLKVLTNGTLSNLTGLNRLSAQRCDLLRLETNSLMGLNNLTSLDLTANNLDVLSKEAPNGVFSHVPKLRELHLRENECWAPFSSSDLLQDLSNLERLDLESCPVLQMGSGMAALQELRHLEIGGLFLKEVHNTSLKGLEKVPLENFTLFYSHAMNVITHFDIKVFQYLSNLKVLRLHDIHIGNKRALESLWAFQNRSLDLIEFRAIALEPFSSKRLDDGQITANDTRFLNAVSVEEFRWINCDLFTIQPDAFMISSNFVRGIKKFTFAGNVFRSADQYRILYYRLFAFPQLKELLYGGLTYNNDEVTEYLQRTSRIMHEVTKLNNDSETAAKDMCKRTINDHQRQPGIETLRNAHDVIATNTDGTLALTQTDLDKRCWGVQFFLRNLRVVRIFNQIWTIELEDIAILNGTNILEVYLVNCNQVHFEGFLKNVLNVRLLDISNSLIIWENNDFFDSLPGLTILLMNSFKNKEKLKDWGKQRFTAGLSNLTYLEANDNNLDYLPSDIFASNVNLRNVSFRGNRFSRLPFDLDTLPKLSKLDLRQNAILSLEDTEMKKLDQRVQSLGPFSLMLRGNTFVCGCEQLRFMGWLKSTNVTLDQDDYSCISQSGHLTSTRRLDTQAMWRHCVGPVAFCISLVVACLMALTFLLTYMWSKLKMAVLAFVFSVFVPSFRLKTPEDYKFQVFLGYADDDFRFVRYTLLPCLEEEMGMKQTFVHQRDFGRLTSGYADEQLLDAIHNSWRILLVVSENFLCNYDKLDIVVQMCSRCVSAENPRRVLALVHEPLTSRLPRELVPVLAEDSVLPVQTWRLPLTHAQKLRLREALAV